MREKDVLYYKRKVAQFYALIRATTFINSSLELSEVLKLILASAKALLNADACSILLLSDNTDRLDFEVVIGRVGEKLMEANIPLKRGEGIAGWVAETGRSEIINDVYKCPHFCKAFDEFSGYKTRSMICIPLKVKGKIIGVAQIINKLNDGMFTEEDKELFENFGIYAAIAIENAKLHESLLEKERVERDLELAKKVQQGFLPKVVPDIKSFKLWVHYVPARYVGGDFYHFIPLKDNKIAFVIGDVSGKGVPAALLMARLLSDIRFLSVSCHSPTETMYYINNTICDEVQSGMFATLIYGVLDPEAVKLRLAIAGHPLPVVWDKETNSFVELSCKPGLPVGIMKNIQYKVCDVDMHNKYFIFYTDGVTDARNNAGQELGLKGFLDIVSRGIKNQNLKEQIVDSINIFLQGEHQFDDITLLCIEHIGK